VQRLGGTIHWAKVTALVNGLNMKLRGKLIDAAGQPVGNEFDIGVEAYAGAQDWAMADPAITVGRDVPIIPKGYAWVLAWEVYKAESCG
jgi:hypothetical protein